MNIIHLSSLDLILASSLVMLLAALAFLMQLNITQKLVIAGIRTTVQLLLVGLVLKVLFANAELHWIIVMSVVMLLVAGREVMSRQQRRLKGMWGYLLGTGSMFIAAFATSIFALLFVVGNTPWYEPQYSIPLLGMMLGNTMNGVALGLDRLTQSVWQQRASIEAKLALGYEWRSAIRDIVRDSVRIGLMPIINAMAAAGIVSLPGMMTGQILAGAEPLEAVKYQIMIMFMITAGTGFATIIATYIGAKRMFDERCRLRLERIT